MVVSDDQVVAGFVALAGAVAALSTAVVMLWRREARCQKRMSELNENFNWVLGVLGEPIRPRRRHASGNRTTIPS